MSSTTTIVALSSILDLLGPAAPTSSPAKDQPPFDELLKAPVPPTFEGRAEAPTAPRRDDTARDSTTTTPQSSSDANDSAQDEAQAASGDEQTLSGEVANEATEPSQPEPQPSAIANELLVESLAGLAALATPLTAPNAPIVADDASDAVEQAPIDVEFTATKFKQASASISATSVAPGQAELTQGTANAAPVTAESSLAQSTADPQSPFDASAVEGASAESPSRETEPSASDLSVLEKASPGTFNESTTDSSDRQNHESSNGEPADRELASGLESSSLATPPATESTNQPPPAAPLAQPNTPADSPAAAAIANSASAIAASGSSQSRLPADVLTQPAGPSNRRSAPAIDATRLLTRVARAFAAAQERDGEIRLRLSPPELGSLRLEVRIQNGAMVARLQTETEAARTAIVENLPALRERLSDQGVRIERFEVDLMQRQPGGMPDQSGGQQPDAKASPLRVAPALRPRSEGSLTTRPSPAASSTGGLNVIV